MEMETNSRNIFWGLVVKPGKRYETEVQEPFRITKACLEMSTAGESVSSLKIEFDNNEEFTIANLSSSVSTTTLDLGDLGRQKICFKVDGPGTVHLTGVWGAAMNFTEEPSQGSPRVEEAEEEEADLEGAAKNFTQEQVEAVKRVRCKNYYEILGLSKDSTDADLKKAYRKLALAFHPDKNKTPGASEAFKAIGNAYAVLSDEGKRRRYDLYGSDEEQQTARSSSSSFVESSDDSD